MRRVCITGWLFRLRDYAAGDACRSRGCRSIGNGVNNDRSPPIAEHGIVTTPESDVRSHNANMRRVIRGDYQRKIRDVPGRCAVFVTRAGRTKVRTRGFEIGCVTFAYLMDMNGMLAGRQILDVEFDFYTLLCGRKRRGADALAFRVLYIYDNRLRLAAGLRLECDCGQE